jgi:hypothetical protein
VSNILYPGTGHAVTVTVEAGFGSGPLTDAPTWTDISAYVRNLSTFRGKTGELDDVQVGSMRAVLSSPNREFDPTNGPAYVTFPGTSGSYWSVPDIAAFGGATSLDIRAAVQFTLWASTGVIAAHGTLGSTLCWQLSLTGAAQLSLTLSTGGVASTATTSAARVTSADGQLMAVRATWESSAGATVLYAKRTTERRARIDCESDDGWLVIGTGTNVLAGLFNSATVVSVGARPDGTGNLPSGARVLFVSVNADGTNRLILDPVSAGSHPSTPPTSWVSELGGTWTRTGTASVVLAGPYWRNLVPGVPIRFRATYNAVTYDVWRGYVLRWPVEYIEMGQDTVVEVEAVDLLAWLDEFECPDTPFGIEVEKAGRDVTEGYIGAYWPLHEPYPKREFGDRYGVDGGSFQGTVQTGEASQPAALVPTRQFGEAGSVVPSKAVQNPRITLPAGPFVFYSLQLGFWVHVPDPTAQFQVIIGGGFAWINDPSGTSYVQYNSGTSSGISVVEPVPVGAHYCTVWSTGGVVMEVYVDGVREEGLPSGAAVVDFTAYPMLTIGGTGCTISDVHYGAFLSPLNGYRAGVTGRTGDTSGERATWLLAAAGVPSGRYTVTSDPSTFLGPAEGGGSHLSQLRAVNAAEQGRLHIDGAGRIVLRSRVWRFTNTVSITSQATFGDSTGEVPYRDVVIDAGTRDTITNTARIGTSSGATGEAVDRDSVAAYGVQPFSAGGLPLANAADAANCAQWVISERAHPRTRVRQLTVMSAGNATVAYPQMLGRELGDRVTVNRRPINPSTKAITGPTISEQVTIEGVAHVVTPGVWETQFHTAPAIRTAAQGGYFTADDAALSVVDSGVVVAY